MVEPGVGADAAGAGDVAEAADVAGLVGGQDGGAGEPVVDDAVGQRQVDDLGEVGGDRPQLRGVGQPLQRDAAGADGAAQQPVPGHRRVEAQQPFADPLAWALASEKPTSLQSAPMSATWL